MRVVGLRQVDGMALGGDVAAGTNNLPIDAREAAWHVCIVFETVGIAYAQDLTDKRIVRSVFSYRIRKAWNSPTLIMSES